MDKIYQVSSSNFDICTMSFMCVIVIDWLIDLELYSTA